LQNYFLFLFFSTKKNSYERWRWSGSLEKLRLLKLGIGFAAETAGAVGGIGIPAKTAGSGIGKFGGGIGAIISKPL